MYALVRLDIGARTNIHQLHASGHTTNIIMHTIIAVYI
jgi:hypothetical protein